MKARDYTIDHSGRSYRVTIFKDKGQVSRASDVMVNVYDISGKLLFEKRVGSAAKGEIAAMVFIKEGKK